MGPRQASLPHSRTLTLAAIRSVHICLGQWEGGPGGAPSRTPGAIAGRRRARDTPPTQNLQSLTFKPPQRRAPDQHRRPDAGPASWLPLATVGRFLLGLRSKSRAPGIAVPPVNQRERGGRCGVRRVDRAGAGGARGGVDPAGRPEGGEAKVPGAR